MNAVIMVGYFVIGFFGTRLARRGIHARHMFGAGFALNLAALALIWLRVPGAGPVVVALRPGRRVNVLGFTTLNEGFAARSRGTHQHDAQPRDVRRRLRIAVGHRRRRRRVARGSRPRHGGRPARRLRRRAGDATRSRTCGSCAAGSATLHASAVRRKVGRPELMHLHILGICGTFMGGIAAIAKTAGHVVTGCDANVYPPMSTQLSKRSASS